MPTNLGASVNFAGADLTPGLSFDGRNLVFVSGQARGGLGIQDSWMSTRDQIDDDDDNDDDGDDDD